MKNTSITSIGAAALALLLIEGSPISVFGQTDEGQESRSDLPSALHPGAITLDCADEACASVARGRAAFTQRNLHQLGGNGRSCADCHMPSQAFQLSPAAVKARFNALLARRIYDQNADDPLFRPVDADDFRVNGQNASTYSNLVENGLVRVTMRLPANVKLLDPITNEPMPQDFVDLWRAVQSVLDVAITGPDGVLPIHPPGAPRVPIMGQDPNGPNRQGGYQSDARFGSLQEQARAALISHAQVSVEPSQQILDDLTAFPRPPSDFPAGPARLERNVQKYQITLANGAVTNITTSDPGRLLLTGQIADLGMMDVPNLRGISRTAPYFHNNSAATLEEMLDHYDALFARIARILPPPNRPPILSSNGVDWDRGFVLESERSALLAYRRKL